MNKKKTLTILSVFVTFFVLLSVAVYAAFTYVNSFQASISTNTITNGTLLSTSTNKDMVFTNPGDTFTQEYTLKNEDVDKNYTYYFELFNNNTEDINSISQMIYVYQDETYVGLLYEFITEDVGRTKKTLPNNYFIFGSEELTTTFTFELHNGATNLTENGNNVSISLGCVIQTPNVQDYIFVSTSEELKKAIDDVNRSSNTKTIVFTNNIVLDTELTITKPCIIDLCSYSLELSSNININSNIKLIDSRNINNDITTTNDSKFVLNNTNSFINPHIDLSSISTISNYDIDMVYTTSKELLESIQVVSSGTTYNLIDNLSMYIGKQHTDENSSTYTFELNVDGTPSTGVLDLTTGYNTNDVIYITINNKEVSTDIDIKVIGSDTDYDTIIKTSLAHLTQFESSDNSIQVGYDLFLPTNLKKYGITINWFSNKQNIVSNEGLLQSEQGSVTLTATIMFNDVIYIKNYYVYVVIQDNQSKLQYLASKVEQSTGFFLNHLNEPYTSLPVANNYIDIAGRDLGILELSYEIESSYYYISLNNTFGTETSNIDKTKLQLTDSAVYLNQITYQKAARIVIKGYFDNEEICEAYISIQIVLSESDIADQIFTDIQTYLNGVDVLQNMIDTRLIDGINNEKGDFDLLSTVSTATIQYASSNENLYTIENNKVVFNDYTLFNISNTSVSIKAQIVTTDTEGNSSVVTEKDLYFRIPGAITVNNISGFQPIADNTNTANLKNIFYTIKYQALEQSTPDAFYKVSDDNTIAINKIKDIDKITSLAGYILIHDIENTQQLIFEYGPNSVVFNYYDITILSNLFDWATSNSGTGQLVTDFNSSLVNYIDSNLIWISSDGAETLSDEEIELILSFCDRYPGFSDIWTKKINVLDNRLSQEDIAKLLETLASDRTFVNILNWITDNSGSVTSLETCIGEDKDTISLPEEVYLLMNDGNNTVTNREEQIIVNYVMANKEEAIYKDFYEKWNAAFTRTRNSFAQADGTYTVNEITSDANNYYTISDTETNTGSNQADIYKYPGLDSCYDPVFSLLLGWARFNEEATSTGNSNCISLRDLLINNNFEWIIEDTNIFDGLLDIKNDWLYHKHPQVASLVAFGDWTTFDEWRVITAWGKMYEFVDNGNIYFNFDYSSHYQEKVTESADYSNFDEYSYSYNGKSILVSGLNKYYESSGNFIVKRINLAGSYLSDAFFNILIGLINSGYVQENSTYDFNFKNIVDDYNKIYKQTIKIDSYNVQYLSELADLNSTVLAYVENQVGYSLSSLLINDSLISVSYSEYTVIKSYYDVIKEYIATVINENFSDTIKNVFDSFYFPSDALDMSITDNVIDTADKTNILNTIEDTTVFYEILDNITLSGGTSVPTDYYDQLSTISAKELETLVNQFIDNEAFVNALNESITTYEITRTSNSDGTYSVSVVVNEEFINSDGTTIKRDIELNESDITDIMTFVRTLLNNGVVIEVEEYNTLSYNYITLDQISSEEVEAFNSLRYFINLEELSFKGNQFHTLFTDSVSSNTLFNIVANTCTSIKELTFNYSLLSDISSISTLVNLTTIDLKGNNQSSNGNDIYEFNDLSPILALYYNQINEAATGISFLNIYNTNISYSNAELYLIKLYEYYYTKNGENPSYYYELNAEEHLFEMNTSNIVAIEMASLLKEIGEITSGILYLPKLVYSQNGTGNITWLISSTDTNASINLNGDILIVSNSGTIVLSATVTIDVNGVTQTSTRYFIIEVSIT